MRLVFVSSRKKPRPKVGDVRMIRGVEHVRELAYAHDAQGRVIGLDCTGGRQRYVWRPKVAPEVPRG